MNQNNKRAAIIELRVYQIDNSSIINTPGSTFIKVSGEPWVLHPRSAEFKETITPDGEVSQQFSAIITDVSQSSVDSMRSRLLVPAIVGLKFSNGDLRAVGCRDFPVVFTLEESGRPAQVKISFKRTSPEPSKFIRSF